MAAQGNAAVHAALYLMASAQTDYTALPVPFGTVFFTYDTLRYMWDRHRTCADFFTEALQLRGCPVALEEVKWWMARYNVGPTDTDSFDEFLADFFYKGYTLKTSLYPAKALDKGAIYINSKIKTTKYSTSDMASIYSANKSKFAQDFYALKLDDLPNLMAAAVKEADAVFSGAGNGFTMYQLKVKVPPATWTNKVDDIFVRLLETTCAEDYIAQAMDQGEFVYSAIRPFIPPEKFGSLGLTENPWGLPISIMKALEGYSPQWRAYFQGQLESFAGDQQISDLMGGGGATSADTIDDAFQRRDNLTLAYGTALKKTVKKFAPDDLALKTLAENFYRFSMNIANTNEELRDMQDKAFTASVVGMIAGMAIGWGMSQVFGPYLSSLTNAAGQAAGQIGAAVTQQLGKMAVKQLSGALVSSIVSVPEFDPPRMLAMLPMPDEPVTSAEVSQSRTLAQNALDAAMAARDLAATSNQNPASALNAALEKAKTAFEAVALTRDDTAMQILIATRDVLDEAAQIVATRSGLPAQTIPAQNLPAVVQDNTPVDTDGYFENELSDTPQVITAGASSSKTSMILALVAVGFALAIPMKDKK